MSKSQKTVDYPTAIPEVRSYVSKAATAYKRWASQEGGKTMAAVHATRAALHSGYLANDGRDPERDPESKTRTEYAALFGVTPAQVTFWRTLAAALDAGLPEDHPTFAVVLLGKKMARRSKVAEACSKSPDAIRDALESEGIDPITGERKGNTSSPRNVGGSAKGDEGTAPEDTEPVTAEVQVAQALAALNAGLKDLDVKSPLWVKVRKGMTDILRREDTLRGTGPKATPKGTTASKATAA